MTKPYTHLKTQREKMIAEHIDYHVTRYINIIDKSIDESVLDIGQSCIRVKLNDFLILNPLVKKAMIDKILNHYKEHHYNTIYDDNNDHIVIYF